MAEEQVKQEEEKVEKVEAASEELEIEISDDTPEADQNRKNLPKELVEKLESDELSEYDDKVKDKIYQLKKVWHDERREKERIQRENAEAVKAAQKLINENKKLKEQFAKNAETGIDLELKAAKQEYKDAYELNDSDKIFDAQQKLNNINSRAEKVKALKNTLQKEPNEAQSDQQNVPAALPPDAKAIEWQKKNDWFGKDEEMTSLALGLHEKLVKQNGVAYATTDEYYDRINDTMRKRFPEHFDSESAEVETKETTKAKPAAVVAPVSRTTSSKKIRLTSSQVNLAKKLGLSPEQYAKELIRLENRNG